jgi:hypothetical protein
MTTTADDDLSAKAAAATSSDSLRVRLIAASVKGWPCGESHGRVVYSDQVVAEARRLRALGMGLHAIARRLRVRTTTVADWLSGRRRSPAARVLAKLGPPRRDGAAPAKVGRIRSASFGSNHQPAQRSPMNNAEPSAGDHADTGSDTDSCTTEAT